MYGLFDCRVLRQLFNTTDTNIFFDGSTIFRKILEHSSEVRVVFIGVVAANIDAVHLERTRLEIDDAKEDFSECRFSWKKAEYYF